MSLAVPLAAAAAGGMYLNAKAHILKDLRTLKNLLTARLDYEKTVKANRQSLWYLFEAQVNAMPDSEICVWSRETGDLTWKQVHAQACQWAEWLRQEGVVPGQLVGFYLTNSAEFVLAFLACWALGTAPAMFNYNLGGEGLLHCIKTAECKIILVDEDQDVAKRMEELRDTVEGEYGIKIRPLDRVRKVKIARLDPKRPDDEWRANVKGEDPMMLLFTSGTTGFPKACAFHVSRAHAGAGPRIRGLGLEPGPNADRWYVPMPMYHGTGANAAVMCFMCGVTLCIGKKFSSSLFWDDIRTSRATSFVYVGETARYLLAAPPSPRDKDHNVKMMFGNGMRPDVWRRFQQRFGVTQVSEFFNSTEGVFTLLNIARGDFFATAVGHWGLILRLLSYRTVVPVEVDPSTNEIIRDPETGYAKRAPYDVGGEMLVAVPDKGPDSGFIGYYKNEEATNKRFAEDVFKKGDLWFRSGDALRRDSSGRWYFLDRLGDTFRWKSENVSTAEVGSVIGDYPNIVEANVYGVLVPKHDGRAGCAAIFIPHEKREKFDFAEFLQYMRQRLPRYAVPLFLRLIQAPTPMHNNKQNKVPLRQEGVDLEKVKNGSSPNDTLLWAPMDANTFTPFGEKEAQMIEAGKARL